ncbi:MULTISPECIES: 3-hydroxyacyl-CoA dehydrogenase NAD-binding domain-containing protein [unclassified Chelatococcus]|uniref:3-hydroxyacyl-CoA dehydrogenase NAD-binding domain-containing protein n=1 Tax=unclassified Chelatococcus TaxID=2638111 RepID=UPI001BCB0AAD|nr:MULTISPECIES: 3-hydroxyacyl-CoA dehydrogenase NAD-binding domain-containing protein [unclassified Chelatococcus]MBS7696722.1 enoyl-CoA hydratase/isomerase family protein [Chelatococcus sp. YT9]MBX3555287.1 enoyl-CoA hydratase/isomerase family protein [Chelatococcus sp.]
MNLVNFRFEIDTDGIALATWDMPDRSMNVITTEVMDELTLIVDGVAADEEIKGCVITSGKDSFSGGADLSMLQDLGRSYALLKGERGEIEAMRVFFEQSRRLSQLYRALETCGKPFAIAIHGICLGGAFELALACHYRVLSDADATRVGLPEIKVGLFPGAGGSQRLPRLMPTPDALQLMARGEQLRPAAAKKLGIAGAVVARETIVESAKDWIRQGGKAVAPWDEQGFRPPSGKVYSPAGMQIWPAANAIYRRETQDNYPAGRALLQAVYEGLQLPMDQALTVESRYFASILRSPVAAAMIRTLFLSKQELDKGARRPKEIPPSRPATVGIVGAGFMGAAITYVSALAGIKVVLVDRDQETAEKGKSLSHKLMTDQIMKGRAKTSDRDRLLELITATPDYTALSTCDLVIEAVFEDPKVKAEVLGRIDAVLKDDAILATNTSTLPVSGLARAITRPERFVGIHFFSPVEKMLLVEVIRGQGTSDRALAVALDFVRALKKTPIVVNDARGFYANRCVLAYVREGHIMLGEGVPPAMIENVAKQAGMPVGPLALNDEVALDLALRIVRATKAEAGNDAVDPAQEALLVALVEGEGRLGRKNRKGFYDYPEGKPKHLWPGLRAFQPVQQNPDAIDIAVLKQRFLVVQALEAARAMEEKVLTDPREGDVGAILGFGFAPFTGGPLSYIDGMGAATFVGLSERLAAAHGPRFAPCDLLVEMARTGTAFYARDERSAAA